MSEYLSKEEIKQWRSSLEKITLEEFAKRLGKTLKEEKQTRDIVDIVLKNEKISASVSEIKKEKPKDKILKVASKSVEMQKEIMDKKENKKEAFANLQISFKKSSQSNQYQIHPQQSKLFCTHLQASTLLQKKWPAIPTGTTGHFDWKTEVFLQTNKFPIHAANIICTPASS